MRGKRVRGVVLAVWLAGVLPAAGADDWDREPIRYATTTPDNAVSRLQKKLDAGKAQLGHDPELGYLKALLRELDVPISSQMLVFSKTSLQRHRITPRTPRALYFSDEVYVGYCHHGDVLEVSAVDARLGTVFYTLEQNARKMTR